MLEIFCATGRQARELVCKFGGGIEPLRRDWLQHWMKQAGAKPLRIGSHLLILSAPAQRVTNARSIVIPAEAAFGTGHHATTAMCLRLLEELTRHLAPGWTMLDAGTGSGILAIAGRYFGAGRVLAIDHDPLACATAKRNARANGIRNIEFSVDDVLKQKLTRKLDVVTANLFSEILIEALPLWSRHLATGGHLILSGVLRSQESAVLRALRRQDFSELEIRRRGKWIALHARK
jgi:ribosomal protein L11 methyltransferase